MFGSTKFAIIYVLSGVLANLATYAIGISPASLGASGSVFGILGALGAYCYAYRGRLGSLEQQSNTKYILY